MGGKGKGGEGKGRGGERKGGEGKDDLHPTLFLGPGALHLLINTVT